ncbi:MAG: head-tail adaptor protein, partial [Clostridia bacterium]|nr:head-tail adaptor protein [Clostridia bacterium]
SLLIPTYSNNVGVEAKAYPKASNGLMFYGSFRTFGGTERDINGVYSVEKTAVVETWFRPDIKSDCRIAVLQTGEIYEILGEPENIELRNQYLKFKVRQIKGGA